jgi:tRNA(Met) C34 N-acetyltransferase TmcA
MLHDQNATGIDAIGASFANDTASVEFWRENGYTTFHKGYRKNPRTGEQAIAVLRSKGPLVSRSLGTAAQIINDNQAWLLATASSTEFEPKCVLSKPQSDLISELTFDTQPNDQQLLEQFCKGFRSFHDTYAAISRLSQNHPISLQQSEGVSRKRFEKALREQVRIILEK